MAGDTCTMCGRKVPLMQRDWTSGLCPQCPLQGRQAAGQATLDDLRRLEDRFLQLIVSLTPKPWRPALERTMSNARFRGLTKLVGGLVVAVATFLVTLGIGMLTGYYHASALVGFPLAVSMVGLMEIVLGVNFADLAARFDQGGFFLKLGIAIVVLCFVAVFLAGCAFLYSSIYRRYFS
jgi:hypothetical protein